VSVPQPPVRGRRGPSRGQLLLRRVVGVVVLIGLLGGGAAVAAWGLRTVREEPPPPTTVAKPKPPKPLRIIFPEGFTRDDMAVRISEVNKIAKEKRNVTPLLNAQRYRELTADHPYPAEFAGDGKRRNLEGFLFPATYEFLPKTTTSQLVTEQLKTFRRNWAKIDLAYAKSKNLTPYDVLIIASLVEKETLAPDERPLVAAVIYNRLKIGMTLGIDATIRYGLKVPGTESLRQSHLRDPTPYNTRIHVGLPPGPIANPGLASMQAAAHPKQVNYLYFVRKPDKVHHFFTASEDEFYRKSCEYGYGC
jgi:uncharacterized YceG family protein